MHYNLAITSTWFFWDWEKARKEFKEAILLSPKDAETRAYYAHYLNIMHRFAEGEEQAQEALKLQPKNSTIRTLYAMHLNHSGAFEKAIKVLEETLETDPAYGMALSTLWTVYHNSGQFDKAAETAKHLYALKGENTVVDILINNYVDHGYQAAMSEIARAFIVKSDTSYVTPWQIATLFVRADNRDEALDWLEKAYRAEDPNMPYINCDPIFDNLKETKRFQALLQNMALPLE
jgi:tetratricopeptide (TPR) repeat protein